MKKLVNESLISFLNENMKDELINKLMNTVYKGDSSQRTFLQTLSEDELDQKLSDYYLYDIERKSKEKK
jgi:hypothetical protein